MAWTSDATGRWASAWVTWEEFARFWGGVARWVLPPPADSDLALRVEPTGETAQAVVDVFAAEGEEADALELQLQVSAPGSVLPAQTVMLRQRAPGRYVGEFVAPEPGAYLLRLHGERHLTTGWVRSYPEEYRPGDGDAALARLGASAEASVVADPGEVFVRTLRGRERGEALAPALLLAGLLLWPVDIAWRRLRLTPFDFLRAGQGAYQRVFAWLAPRLPRRRTRGAGGSPKGARVSSTDAAGSGGEHQGRAPSTMEPAEEESLASRLKQRLRE